ncbi:hypothetical protein JCM19037_1598 [Geomicrobium sp. JCM 19037]|uniref:haloacid dehalogenase n=1 Tax=Geomicrobium sp. JCM 19037 TaxID=1460634 RepID=UPI00045F105D|nr:haloacid dehalogenase [Geomicrobium sp. JCM 19037]GAK03285.1 hypothetical protein JCM19037_1598 [Geomicrobium sp. JCM 19037]
MNKQYADVAEFHRKFGHPVAEKPAKLDEARAQQRYGYMREELDEFSDAASVTDQADAMIDLIYLALGTLVEMGVRPAELFEIVHDANMSKLWADGQPRYDQATGKVLKPPSFIAPEPLLEAEIERQLFI